MAKSRPVPGRTRTAQPNAERVSPFARIVDLDDRILRRVVKNRGSLATFLLASLCRLHDPDNLTFIIAVLALTGAREVSERLSIVLVVTSILVVIVKRTVKRKRPSGDIQALVPPDRFSFPSGHTAAGFAIALAMTGVMPVVVPPLIVSAILVGYARMYLGVHYPIDVAAGAAIGLLVGSLVALL